MVKNLMPWKKNRHEAEVLHPFRDDPAYELTRGLSDMFDGFFRRFDEEFGSPLMRREFGFSNMPSVDVEETEKEVIVTADLPGLDEKDLKVSLEGDALTLSGERKHEKEEKNKNYHRVERAYGTFTRSIGLPEGIDRDNVKAAFKKGVLTVKIAKLPGAKPSRRHIEVEAG